MSNDHSDLKCEQDQLTICNDAVYQVHHFDEKKVLMGHKNSPENRTFYFENPIFNTLCDYHDHETFVHSTNATEIGIMQQDSSS